MVSADLDGRAHREQGAVVQDVDARANLHDQPDVVFHQEDRHAFRGQRPQERDEAASLAVAQTRGRFVEQQQARAGSEGPAQLAQAGQSGGEGIGPFVGDVPQPDAVENRLGVIGRVATEIVRPASPDLGGDENVLTYAERPEQLEVLERARDTEAGSLSRPRVGDVAFVEGERAGDALLQSGDGIEDRRLARAVRTDEAGDAAAFDVEVDVGHGVVAAEAHGESANFKQRHCSPRR